MSDGSGDEYESSETQQDFDTRFLVQEQRMQMMHLASKKKELEHNIANCPNEALRNRFRQELQGVQNDIKRLEGGGFS